jgi:subtilisin family serine protease
MKKNRQLQLALPLVMLIILASCSKDPKTLTLRNSTLNNVQHDREFIVIAKEGVKLEAISKSLLALGVKKFALLDAKEEIGLIHVRTPDPSFPVKAKLIKDVESVVVDIRMNFRLPEKTYRSNVRNTRDVNAAAKSKAVAVNNPYSFLQWGLKSVKAPEAWAKGYKGKGAKVAVLDGGFLLGESEIASKIILTHSFVDGEEVQYHGAEGFSHGTHVAGTIAAADDAYGVVGVAPEAQLMLIKVLSDGGSGAFSGIIDGIFYATNHGANVINMSLGGELPRKTFTDDNGTPDDPSDDYVVEYDRDIKDLVKAINRSTLYATLLGTTVVAAAGNDAYNYDTEKRFITYPAAAQGVLSIASNGPLGWGINQDTTLYRPSIFTNYGKAFISYGAPGGNYTLPPNTTVVNVGGIINYEYVFDLVFNVGAWDEATGDYYYTWAAGTSMAAPAATGVIALIYGKHPKISPILVDLILKQSSTDYGAHGKDAYFGYGQVNAGKAVNY